jgi:hypothetical protein
MNLKKILIFFFPFFFLMETVKAHCPLCTIGAAAAAGGAVWLGVDILVVALFIGAFAVSTGWWFSRIIKKKFIPFQNWIIIISSFLLTIIPIRKMLSDLRPWYIHLSGEYGSLLNRTYVIDLFVVGAIIGGLVVCIAPPLSKKLTRMRNGKLIPFQGVIITIGLLLLLGVILQGVS